MELNQISDGSLQSSTFKNHVNLTMLEQILCRLEVGRKFLPDSLLDHTATGKADPGTKFGDDNITEHGKACRHSTKGGLGKNTYI